MFGIFFAAICGIGLYRLWHPRRFHRYAYGWAGGGGGGRCGGRGFEGRRGRRFSRLMQELKTTPAQEAAIHRTIEEVRAAMRSAGPWTLIDPLTAALTADTWDREKLFQAMREKQDSLPNALANAIERLRETLDPEQRRRLVELINQRFNPNRTTHL